MIHSKYHINFAWLLVLSAAGCPAGAQDTPVFRSQTTLVTLRFHVLRGGHYSIDLKPEDIVLLEDGAPRKFTVFENAMSSVEAKPVEMTLLFDTSGSVTDKGLLDPLVFRESLLDSLPNVRIAVYGFGSRLTRFCGPTRDFEKIRGALAALRDRGAGENIPLQLPPGRKSNPRGATWLYEAIRAVSQEAAATPGDATRMLMVASDGLPSTTSKPEDAAELDRELGIPVYPLILGHRELARRIEEAQHSRNQERRMRLESTLNEVADFARLGEMTGGRSFDPPEVDLNAMRQVLIGMVAEVSAEYTVGFSADPSPNPRRHKLEVRLVGKDLGKVKGGTRTVVH